MVNAPAAGYKFNNFQEIKSHSSILFNERMAILFYLLDVKSITMNANRDFASMMEVKSVLWQIYKNVRTLIRNNPTMRSTLNLDTKDEGVYIIDVIFGIVNKVVDECDSTYYTPRRLNYIIDNLNNAEMIIKDVLQYYHYFIRPDFIQKPDVEVATEQYKQVADAFTIEELKKVVGKNNLIDFESLGSSRIDLHQPDSDAVPQDEDEDLKDIEDKKDFYEHQGRR